MIRGTGAQNQQANWISLCSSTQDQCNTNSPFTHNCLPLCSSLDNSGVHSSEAAIPQDGIKTNFLVFEGSFTKWTCDRKLNCSMHAGNQDSSVKLFMLAAEIHCCCPTEIFHIMYNVCIYLPVLFNMLSHYFLFWQKDAGCTKTNWIGVRWAPPQQQIVETASYSALNTN